MIFAKKLVKLKHVFHQNCNLTKILMCAVYVVFRAGDNFCKSFAKIVPIQKNYIYCYFFNELKKVVMLEQRHLETAQVDFIVEFQSDFGAAQNGQVCPDT